MTIFHATLLLAGALILQEPDKRSSPFTKVKWQGDTPIVEFEGAWYPLVSMNGVERDALVAFLKKEYDDDWKKRFGEDIVEAMEDMGKPIKDVKVALVLEKDGKKVEKTGTMDKDNRRSVRDYNRANPDMIEVESTRPRRSRPSTGLSSRDTFGFAAAKIVFKYTGSVTGTDTLYVLEEGKTLLLDRDKKYAFPVKSTTFVKEGVATTSDHLKKRYLVSKLRPMDTKLSVLSASERMMARVGLIKKGEEEVAGKTCVLFEKIDGEKVWRTWRWKGIELKIEFRNWLNTSYVKEAVSVEEGITEIPAQLTRIPEGYSKQ